jgi:hypothetical protein
MQFPEVAGYPRVTVFFQCGIVPYRRKQASGSLGAMFSGLMNSVALLHCAELFFGDGERSVDRCNCKSADIVLPAIKLT